MLGCVGCVVLNEILGGFEWFEGVGCEVEVVYEVVCYVVLVCEVVCCGCFG